MSEKIRAHHLDRKAILYVRQSSAYQVMHNLESQKLQYAMEERLRQLGWGEIEVVDEDLGRSAAGTVARSGFERMVQKCASAKWVQSPLAMSSICCGNVRSRRGRRKRDEESWW